MREIPFCFQSIFVSGQIILCNSTVKWQTSFGFGSCFTSGEQKKERWWELEPLKICVHIRASNSKSIDNK